MKHFYKLILTALLLPFFSVAQTNYKPGYVVKLKGDTLHGFIDYKEWDKNPRKIAFKYSINTGPSLAFSIADASAFGVTGQESYRRYILPVSQDKVEIGSLSPQIDTTSITDTVFLKVLTYGKRLTLFSYTDDIKLRFYLLDKGQSQPEELIYHAYYNPDESSSAKFINRYRGQLEYLAQKYVVNNSQLDQKILQSRYVAPELINIVKTINGPSEEALANPNFTGSSWFAGMGINSSTAKYKNVPGTPSTPTTIVSSASFFPKIDGGIDFFPNKSVQQIAIRLELSFTMNQYDLSSEDPIHSTTTALKFSQYNTSFTPQFIYNFYNTEKLKVFIGTGAALNFSAYNSYKSITRLAGFPDFVQDNYPAFSKFWVSFPISAGVTIDKKIELSVRYIPSASMTGDRIASTNVSSIQAGVNFLFGSK